MFGSHRKKNEVGRMKCYEPGPIGNLCRFSRVKELSILWFLSRHPRHIIDFKAFIFRAFCFHVYMPSCLINFIPPDTFTCLTWVYTSLALVKVPFISCGTPSMNNILNSLSKRFYCSQEVVLIDWFSSTFTNVQVGINSKFPLNPLDSLVHFHGQVFIRIQGLY